MRRYTWLVFAAVFVCAVAWADWPTTGGSPSRDGWQRGESSLSRASAKDIKFLYSKRFDNVARGESALTTPVFLARIITWKGFKALMFVGASNDTVYSVDSDLGREFFKSTLGSKGGAPLGATLTCPGGLTAGVTLTGAASGGGRGGGGGGGRGASGGRGAAANAATPVADGASGAVVAGRGRGGRGGGRGGRGASGAVLAQAGAAGASGAPARGGRGGGRGGPQPSVYAVGGDGWLRWVREQDGDTAVEPAIAFLPANARASALTVSGNVVYAATDAECGGNPNGLYAVDLATKATSKLLTNGTGFTGTAGVAIGTDGTVYGQIADGSGTVAGTYSDTVVALDPKTLEVKNYFTPTGTRSAQKKDASTFGATPAVFQWNGKDVIVAGGRDGRIYLLDAAQPGGADHRTPLAQSDVIIAAGGAGNGIRGSFATFTDAADGGSRWIYAAINGAASAKFPTANGTAATGAIVAFKVGGTADKPELSQQWISHDLVSPAAPVVANGLVYALSTGRSPRVSATLAEHEKLAKPAVMYVLDSSTGKEVFSTGTKATTYATTGVAVENGQFYFGTHDNVLYAYGIETEK